MRLELFSKRVIEKLQASGFFPGQSYGEALNELGDLRITVLEQMFKNGHSIKEVAEILEEYLVE